KSFSADLADLKKKNENLKKTSSGDLKSFSGPNPDKVLTDLKLLKSRSGDVYAGSTFDMSPSPRALPLPKFSLRKEAVAISTVDDSATKDLRRLLRIG
ncbi:proline-rich nuclear receptor coactivator motif-containing protein, partial [Ralstonia pseudosolanacearum]|uniref:proline-rich nuclear receptor coactivator motif-containing protein n=1 Tax=Ralstonia pseudosolanacearum TaxID=1310165 RepID=UPI003CE7A0B7